MLEIKEQLSNMKLFTSNRLKRAVIEDILSIRDTNEEIERYMIEVMNYGCTSGVCTSLVYYKDTDLFFKQYYEDILSLVNDYIDEVGSNPVEEFNANNLSWFAYEKIVQDLYYNLDR